MVKTHYRSHPVMAFPEYIRIAKSAASGLLLCFLLTRHEGTLMDAEQRKSDTHDPVRVDVTQIQEWTGMTAREIRIARTSLQDQKLIKFTTREGITTYRFNFKKIDKRRRSL